MPCLSNVCAFHFGLPISSIPVGVPSFSESRQAPHPVSAGSGRAPVRLRSVDADSAAPHLVHHGQQIDLEPIGVARAFPIEDLDQVFQSASVFAASASA